MSLSENIHLESQSDSISCCQPKCNHRDDVCCYSRRPSKRLSSIALSTLSLFSFSFRASVLLSTVYFLSVFFSSSLPSPRLIPVVCVNFRQSAAAFFFFIISFLVTSSSLSRFIAFLTVLIIFAHLFRTRPPLFSLKTLNLKRETMIFKLHKMKNGKEKIWRRKCDLHDVAGNTLAYLHESWTSIQPDDL